MIERIAKVFPWLLLAPAILPLVYVEGLLYPFVSPKTFLFRALAIVAAASFAYLALSGRQFYWERLRNKWSWIPAALLAVVYATSLIGVDFYHSFWSIYDRGDGLLTLTAAVSFFYLVLLYADKDFLRRLFSITAWVGSVVALYAFFQWLQGVSGMEFPFIEETQGSTRLGATLGNAAFLAAYLGMTFFAALAVAMDYTGRWQQALYAGAALQLLVIFLTATRGTLLALMVVGFLVAIYFAIRGDGNVRTYARGGLVAALIMAALFIGFRDSLADFPIEPVRRIASISLTDATVSSRLFVWQNVGGMALQKPLTGYGAEHIDILFNRVYDPSAIVEQWFDRSHNAYLDYFVQFGVLGLILYCTLVLSLAWAGWRLWQAGGRYGPFILLIAFVYAAQNFFVFDTVMTLWFLLALLAAALAPLEISPALARPKGGTGGLFLTGRAVAPRHVSLLAGAVVLALLYPVVVEPLRANLALADGYIYHVTDISRTVDTMTRGLALNTYADIEYGYQLYTMYTDRQQHMLEGEDRVAAYRFARDTLAKNYERYSYDARTAVYLAHVLDSAPSEEEVDEDFLREVLARATELSPKRIQPWYLRANISLKKGDRASGAARSQHYREAIEVLAEYSETVPEYAEPRYIVAGLYHVMGERAAAAEWAAEGLALYKGGGDTAQRAVKYYIGVEDWQNALRFLQDVVGEGWVEDEYDQAYDQVYDLAKLYLLTGDRERAVEIVEHLRRVSPGLVETDPVFLQALEG